MKNLLLYIEKKIKEGSKEKPSNYTERISYDGEIYCYHSETEPHTHKDTKIHWSISFQFWNEKFLFAYFDTKGNFRAIVPELNKKYTFKNRKLHAVILKEDLLKFNDKEFWESKFLKDEIVYGELACVFKFL
jgi:hypothetical protein